MKYSNTLVVDGRVFEGKLTGVGFYIKSVLEALCEWAPKMKVVVISRQRLADHFHATYEVRVEPSLLLAKMKPIVWQKFFSPRMFPSEFDLYWGTAGFLPSWGLQSARTLLTVHDFNHVLVPETMTRGSRFAHALWMASDIRRSDLLMCNSAGTSAKSLSIAKRAADVVVNPPVRNGLKKVEAEELEDTLAKMNVVRPFFFALGAHQPRKNLSLLLRVFTKLKKERSEFSDYSLILAGAPGWRAGSLESEILSARSLGVKSLGYVTDLEASALFSGCAAFVFPSIYEGFGMPVREAIGCGAKVIATDISEIREAAYGQGVFCSPTEQGISSALIDSCSASFRPSERSFHSETCSIENLGRLLLINDSCV